MTCRSPRAMPRGVTTSAAGRISSRPRRGNCRTRAPISAAGGASGGAILGLDVALADFSLVRTSTKPLPRKPSVSDADRREFIEASRSSIRRADRSDRDTIVAAMQTDVHGSKLVRTPADVAGVADALASARTNARSWPGSSRTSRSAPRSFLSPSELLWLGLGADARRRRCDAWGAPRPSPRLGCLCLRADRAAAGSSSPGGTRRHAARARFPT